MWRFTPVLCAVLLAAGPATAQPPADRTYELRTYQAAPGRLDELHARFRRDSLPLLQKHGAEVVGTWVPKPNPDNVVVALLAYPSAAGREAIWSRIVADPQWQGMKRRGDARGLLVEDIAELPLTATAAVRVRGGVGDLELHTHDKPEPITGALATFVPAKPKTGVAMLSLHRRQAGDVPRLQRSLVTLLIADVPEESPQVTVLSPTDYSPNR